VDHDLRAMLDVCRAGGIEAFLFRMPEDRDFQAFYTPQANAAIASYVENIEKEYKVRVIDARSWYPDRDHYLDGHHLDATGAEIFTRRFVSELSNE
jgi:hypothetical protein